jgi:hypothetical protein
LLINMNLESNTKTEKQSNFYKVNLFQRGKKSWSANFTYNWKYDTTDLRNLPIQTKPFSDINEMRRCEKSSVKATIT